jgi:hypothetical protein
MPPDTTSGCLSLDLSKISYRTLQVNDERTRDKSGTQHKNGTIGCPGRHRNFPGTDPRKSELSRENRDRWSPCAYVGLYNKVYIALTGFSDTLAYYFMRFDFSAILNSIEKELRHSLQLYLFHYRQKDQNNMKLR